MNFIRQFFVLIIVACSMQLACAMTHIQPVKPIQPEEQFLKALAQQPDVMFRSGLLEDESILKPALAYARKLVKLRAIEMAGAQTEIARAVTIERLYDSIMIVERFEGLQKKILRRKNDLAQLERQLREMERLREQENKRLRELQTSNQREQNAQRMHPMYDYDARVFADATQAVKYGDIDRLLDVLNRKVLNMVDLQTLLSDACQYDNAMIMQLLIDAAESLQATRPSAAVQLVAAAPHYYETQPINRIRQGGNSNND